MGQDFRACVGILRLAKSYGRERLEAACTRALEIGARSYSSVNSILKNSLDRRRPAMPANGPALTHPTLDQLRALKLDGMVQVMTRPIVVG